MRKLVLVFIASIAFAIVGCKKEETPKGPAKTQPASRPAAKTPAPTPTVTPTPTPTPTPTRPAGTTNPGK